MALLTRLVASFFIMAPTVVEMSHGQCVIPFVMRGTWFSFEKGSNTITDIDDTSMTNHGTCVAIQVYRYDYKALLFKQDECYYCVRFHIRTVNILQKSATGCSTYPPDHKPSLEEACEESDKDTRLVTMFNENYRPKSCRPAIEGVWQFAYQNRFSFTGECNHPEAQIRSCMEKSDQFFSDNLKINITFKKCAGFINNVDETKVFTCLGDWTEGNNHFIGVVNTKASRKEEKYSCFLRNRDDDWYMHHSITSECSTLRTPQNSPSRFRMTPGKSERVTPGCLLPKNFSGDWVNTALTESNIRINQTHIFEKYSDKDGYRLIIYVCREQKDNRYMMARLYTDGCQHSHVCFEFLPRRHDIIRFKKGREMAQEDFSSVCSYIRFKKGREKNYDLLLAKDPAPVKCPIAGKFNFTQKGELKFETRSLMDVTKIPWDDISCRENISVLSVCDTDRKEIRIDARHCVAVNASGQHIDIQTEPDYKLKCIGYWRENFKSYLITYDELDPYSKYRCWVYEKADWNKVLMSESVGSFCNFAQTARNPDNGAVVVLNMVEYKVEHDRCPMEFDDGTNPWEKSGINITVLKFRAESNAALTPTLSGVLLLTLFSFKLSCFG